jgi:hypothetical protein
VGGVDCYFWVFAAFRWLGPWMLDALSPGTDVGKVSELTIAEDSYWPSALSQ